MLLMVGDRGSEILAAFHATAVVGCCSVVLQRLNNTATTAGDEATGWLESSNIWRTLPPLSPRTVESCVRGRCNFLCRLRTTVRLTVITMAVAISHREIPNIIERKIDIVLYERYRK